LKVFQYGLICVQYVLIILVKNLLILVKFHYLCWICVEFVLNLCLFLSPGDDDMHYA